MTGRLKELIAQTALLELTPDAFVGISSEGEIVFANKLAEKLFGYSHDELIDSPIGLLLPERFAAAHDASVAEFVAHPQTRTMGGALDLIGRRSDGAEFLAEISLSSIELDGGEMIAAAAIRDISERDSPVRDRERLQSETERERLVNQLHHARRLESLGELAGGIAHDFNNLLAVIINYAAFVAEDLGSASAESPEKRASMRDDVEQISLAAERAAHLTHQLLAFARREVVKRAVVDVNEIVRDIEQLLRRTLGDQIELHSQLADALRPVLIDPGQLEQILVNLAVNARDAMPDGGTLTIDTSDIELDEEYTATRSDLSPGSYVRLRVSDSGVGMPREVVERAFDPFFTTKSPGQGTGLGLATVYGIVEQAGGRARIYSEAGVGTTFTALLPVTASLATPTRARAEATDLRGDETILIAEDEDALREVTERILDRSGYHVLAAAGGEAALAIAAEYDGPIDLLLTDVIMPRMTGPALAERAAELRPSMHVLFMSGFAHPILESGEHIGADVALVEKPFSPPGLLIKVRAALRAGAQVDEPGGQA